MLEKNTKTKILIQYNYIRKAIVQNRKNRQCIEPSGYETAKNGRLMHFCTCAECGIKKN